MPELIGKIIRIVSPTEVIINLGLKNGVEVGMELIIYEECDDVLDPETNKVLETLEIQKGKVYAQTVQENITLARTKAKGGIFPLTSLFPQVTEEIFREKLNVAEEDIQPLEKYSAEESWKIKVGDKVRLRSR